MVGPLLSTGSALSGGLAARAQAERAQAQPPAVSCGKRKSGDAPGLHLHLVHTCSEGRHGAGLPLLLLKYPLPYVLICPYDFLCGEISLHTKLSWGVAYLCVAS